MAIPKAVMQAIDLHPGDQIWFEVVDDHLRLLPAEVVSRVWRQGRRLAAEQGDALYDAGTED